MRTLLVLLLLPVAGCSTYAPPAMQVGNVQVSEPTTEGVVIDFDIEATNPNRVGLPLRRVHYTLHIDGEIVFRGVRSPNATVRRLGTQRFTLPAVVPAQARTPGEAEYQLAATVSYVTPGEIAELLFDVGVRRPSTSFNHRGVVELP